MKSTSTFFVMVCDLLSLGVFVFWRIRAMLVATVACLTIAGMVFGQEVPTTNDLTAKDEANAAADELSVEQARVADRYKRLEEVLGRLAELSASTDPRRAKLLREAIALSREQDINLRFSSIVRLLEDERLSAAATNQTELQKELDALLTLLLKADRDKELASQRDRVRAYLKEVGRLIRLQQGIRARTEGGDDLPNLSKDQARVASETAKLEDNIAQMEGDQDEKKDESADHHSQSGEEEAKPSPSASGKPAEKSKKGQPAKPTESPAETPAPSEATPSEPNAGEPSESQSQPGDSRPADSSQQGQPGQSDAPSSSENESGQQSAEPQTPADRATQRLRAAQQRMEEARKKLDEAERQGAASEQREALKELEQAKAELERVLRQLREEELERMLTQLAARFRKMLELQNQIYEGTVRLDQVPPARRDHEEEIEAARLSRQQSQLVAETDKALLLLREEGSSVAFPEAVEQMRSDMQQIAQRLAAVKVDVITQGLEQDVIAALEEMISALEKALKDLEKNRTPPGQSGSAPPPGELDLVDKLAELKMIRSLQVRIYNRTKRYGQMISGEQAETAELIEALRQLAERQERVHRATADLELGRNE